MKVRGRVISARTYVYVYDMEVYDMSDTTLGQRIGIIGHIFSVKNTAGVSVQLDIKFDYSTMDDRSIKNLILRSTTIDFQRPTRGLSENEIQELNGSTVIAQNAGHKQKSRSEQIQGFMTAFVAAGIDNDTALELATAAVDNPQLLTTTKEENNE